MSNLFYKTYGDGNKRVLLVHGWASSHTMWNVVHPHIQNATIFAPDLAGFGQSEVGDSDLTVEAHVENIIDFADNIAQPDLIIAHSMGGLITLKALSQRPDLAKQVVLICPVVTGNFGAFGGIAGELMRNSLMVQALRATKNLWGIIQSQYFLNISVPLAHSDPELGEQVKQNFMNTRPEAGIEALISMAQQDATDSLAQLAHPTLVMVSEGDTTVPHTEGRVAAEHIPNADLVVFKASRHHPMNEETDKFVSELRQFIAPLGF